MEKMEDRVSSDLPSVAVEPLDELPNEEWSVKEQSSFQRNKGGYLSGKKEGVFGAVSFSHSVVTSQYYSVTFLLLFSHLLCRCTESFSMQNSDVLRSKVGTTSSTVL